MRGCTPPVEPPGPRCLWHLTSCLDNVAVDMRILTATNRRRRDLERGRDFRVDLYHHLAHAVITLPPLRPRGDCVRQLVERRLAEACTAAGRQVELPTAALQSLADYAWPGNVRQVRAVIERVVLPAKDGRPVTPAQLELHNAEAPPTLDGELEVEERRLVQEALARVGVSRSEAAKILGVPHTTLANRIRRFGLQPSSLSEGAQLGDERVLVPAEVPVRVIGHDAAHRKVLDGQRREPPAPFLPAAHVP